MALLGGGRRRPVGAARSRRARGPRRACAGDRHRDLAARSPRPPARRSRCGDTTSRAIRRPEGPFDLVHARLVLVHLPDRDRALRTMIDVLRPGGWLLVEDADPALQPASVIDAVDAAGALANRLRNGFRDAARRTRRRPRVWAQAAASPARGGPGRRRRPTPTFRSRTRLARRWRSRRSTLLRAQLVDKGLATRRRDRPAPRQRRRRAPRPGATADDLRLGSTFLTARHPL